MSLQEAQEELQNALITTYLANLAFLNEYDNKLFQRVEILSQLINSGEFKENYELEFVKEDGDFDIYDIKNDKYLYKKKPGKYNRNAYHRTDFTSKGSISVLDNELFRAYRFDIIPEVEYMCNFEYSNKKLANETLEYFNILRDDLSSYKIKKFKYVNKFMFIGTLLGRHIPLILEKLKPENFFVCEENLEIFRLSLFVVDYSDLARDGKSVVFSIMEDSHEFAGSIDRFLTNKSEENYCIKYFTSDYNVNNSFDNMTNAILAHKSTTFNHHMMLENMWKNTAARINRYKTLQVLKISENKILNKPVLFVGAGPSLTDNIEWVKENQDKFLIVSIAATYKILFENGIKVDIVATLDPQYSVLNKKHFDKRNVEKLKDCFVFASMNTDQRILNRFNQDKLYLYEMVKPLYTNNICYKAFSVGEMIASIILSFGFKNIYMLGIDFALNQKTGSSHMSGYTSEEYHSNFKDKKHKEESNEFSLREELITVKGNMQEQVYTNRIFALSLDAISSNFAFIKKSYQNIYNLSNHGAYITNTIPTKVEDLDLSSFSNNAGDLKSFLDDVSEDKLSKKDNNDLKNELDYVKFVQKEFIKFEKDKCNNFKEFKENIDKYISLIIKAKTPCSFLHIVFIRYFNVFLQYVLYSLNDKDLKYEEKKIDKIYKLFSKNTLDLLNKYISYLEKI